MQMRACNELNGIFVLQVHVLFVAACSIFLATFLNLRLFLEAHGKSSLM